MLPYLSVAIAGLQTGLNLFAKSEAERKQEEAKKKALELLNRNRLSEEQINTRVNQVGNAFNTQTMEAMNNQAYGINSLLNSDTARTLASAKLAPQRAMAEVQAREQLYNQNAQINNQIAQIEGNPIQSVTTGEIIGGAINTGVQAYSMFKGIENQDKYIDAVKEGFNKTDVPTPITDNNSPYTFPEAIVNGNQQDVTVPRYDNITSNLQNISNKIGNYFNVKTEIPIAKGDNSVYMGVGESNPLMYDYKPTTELTEPTTELEDIEIDENPLGISKKFKRLKKQLDIPIIGEVETVNPQLDINTNYLRIPTYSSDNQVKKNFPRNQFDLFDYQNSYNMLKKKYGGK